MSSLYIAVGLKLVDVSNRGTNGELRVEKEISNGQMAKTGYMYGWEVCNR